MTDSLQSPPSMLQLPNKGVEMEHRQTHREFVNLPVVLKMRDEVLHYGRLNNLSKESALIVINGSAVTRGNIVEVKFRSLPSTVSKQKDCVRGYVIWTDGNKIGLLWFTESAVLTLRQDSPLIPLPWKDASIT